MVLFVFEYHIECASVLPIPFLTDSFKLFTRFLVAVFYLKKGRVKACCFFRVTFLVYVRKDQEGPVEVPDGGSDEACVVSRGKVA